MTLKFPLLLLPTTYRKNNLLCRNYLYHFLPKSTVLSLAIWGVDLVWLKASWGLRMGSCLQGWRVSKEDLFQESERQTESFTLSNHSVWETGHGFTVIGWSMPQSHWTSSENSQGRGIWIVLSLWVSVNWGWELCTSKWRKVKHPSERHTPRKDILGEKNFRWKSRKYTRFIAQLKLAVLYSEWVRFPSSVG